MEPVRLTSCNSTFDAHIIKTKLLNEQIECFITNENFNSIYPCFNDSIDIYVNPKDLDRAKEIIIE